VDYALSHPARLLSLTAAASLCGVTDEDFVAETRRLVPPVWEARPIELRKLSASYRFRDPNGSIRWISMTEKAVVRRIP
jgi:hypothetical protein